MVVGELCSDAQIPSTEINSMRIQASTGLTAQWVPGEDAGWEVSDAPRGGVLAAASPAAGQ